MKNIINRTMAAMGDRAIRNSGILPMMSAENGMSEVIRRLYDKIQLAPDGKTILDMQGNAIGIACMGQVSPEDLGALGPMMGLTPKDMGIETETELPHERPENQDPEDYDPEEDMPELVPRSIPLGLGYISDEAMLRLLAE